MFSYSPRPGTPAQDFLDSVPQPVKSERLQRTMELQKSLTREQGKQFIGQEIDVLVESKSFKPGADFKGRNAQFWSVNFTGDTERIHLGDMAKVVVSEFSGHALRGRAIELNRDGEEIILESVMPASFG